MRGRSVSHHVLVYRLFEPPHAGEENSIRSDVEYGHSYHCAARMVWGDGECECGLLEREEIASTISFQDSSAKAPIHEDRWASTDPAWDDFA